MEFVVAVTQSFRVSFDSDMATEKSAAYIAERIIPRSRPIEGISRYIGGWRAVPLESRADSVRIAAPKIRAADVTSPDEPVKNLELF